MQKSTDGLKIVTIGGGSTYTPELIDGFIKRYDRLPVSEIWLVDVAEGKEKLEVVGAFARRMIKKAGLPIDVYTTLDRRKALRGADFVTTQIRVGQLEARALDERIPLEHGILGQETNGAGGLFNALRTIPVMLSIAQDIHELCPRAWMINFSNPSGMVTEAILRYSPHKRVIGLCNVPIHMEKSAAKLLGVDESRISILFAGLNHMVYGLALYKDGQDAMQELLETVAQPEKAENLSVKNIMPVLYEKSFLKGLGVLVCPYHNYYYESDVMLAEELEQLKNNEFRAAKVMQIENELIELYKDPALDAKPEQLELRGGAYYSEAACRLIDSIYNDTNDIQPLDVRNNGAIWGIDDDSAVEVSCVVGANGATPLHIGKLPPAVNGLVQQIKSFETIAVQAAVEGSYEKALVALTIHPLTPSDKIAKAVVDEMMQAQRALLPRFHISENGM